MWETLSLSKSSPIELQPAGCWSLLVVTDVTGESGKPTYARHRSAEITPFGTDETFFRIIPDASAIRAFGGG